MVIMGSMNMKRGGAIGPGGKKTSKKVTGIGGTANLKRNKLAIAFNNLEVDNNDKDWCMNYRSINTNINLVTFQQMVI